MSKRAKQPSRSNAPADPYPVVLETFKPVGDSHYDRTLMTQDEPTCFNGAVNVRRYRVTVERIDEPVEVLQERVRQLWRKCSNHHHRWPLQSVAAELGMTLDHKECGVERKDHP